MKLFYKMAAAAGTVFLLAGIVLTAAGFLGGARWNDIPIHNLDFTRFGNLVQRHKYKTVEVRRGASGESAVTEDYEDNHSMITEDYEEIQSVDIEVNYGKVYLENGDRFSFRTENIEDGDIECYTEDKTWKIRDNREYGFSCMGIRFGGKSKSGGKIFISIPKSFYADEFQVDFGAGSMKIEEILAKEVDIEVGAGELKVEKLEAKEKADLEVGAGSLEIEEITASVSVLNCGIGKLYVNGEIKKEILADCGVGSIHLNLLGKKEDYNYTVDCSLGTVIIDDERYTSIDKSIINDQGKGKEFEINCDVGSVDVQFES